MNGPFRLSPGSAVPPGLRSIEPDLGDSVALPRPAISQVSSVDSSLAVTAGNFARAQVWRGRALGDSVQSPAPIRIGSFDGGGFGLPGGAFLSYSKSDLSQPFRRNLEGMEDTLKKRKRQGDEGLLGGDILDWVKDKYEEVKTLMSSTDKKDPRAAAIASKLGWLSSNVGKIWFERNLVEILSQANARGKAIEAATDILRMLDMFRSCGIDVMAMMWLGYILQTVYKGGGG